MPYLLSSAVMFFVLASAMAYTQVGTAVILTADSLELRGTIVVSTPDSVTLRPEKGESITLSRHDIISIDYSRPRGSADSFFSLGIVGGYPSLFNGIIGYTSVPWEVHLSGGYFKTVLNGIQLDVQYLFSRERGFTHGPILVIGRHSFFFDGDNVPNEFDPSYYAGLGYCVNANGWYATIGAKIENHEKLGSIWVLSQLGYVLQFR